MKKCLCGKEMKKLKSETPEGVDYEYYKCLSCGEEIVDMKQLHKVAEKYRKIKAYSARITKWGLSLGLRIPKELIKEYKILPNSKVKIIPEKEGLKLIPT